MDDLSTDAPIFTRLELESVKPPEVVEEITSLSWDTVKRRYPKYIVALSPRRTGMKLKFILGIANQTLPPIPNTSNEDPRPRRRPREQ
jgi:hypothetical protein